MKGLDQQLPNWVNIALLPLLNVATAMLVSALVFILIDVDPIEAAEILLYGAFGYQEGIGFTLYYTTNFIFTGLAVAIAFHVGLFNIGGEGQAYIGGLGVGLLCLALDSTLPGPILLLFSVGFAALFGAAWAFIPAWLQAYRGSHIVITTIMFNFIAASLMVYLMANILREPGQMALQSRELSEAAWLPFMHDILAGIGIQFEASPLNFSVILALLLAFATWVFIWKTKWGYEIRTVGLNKDAAVYAGVKPAKVMILAMALSGAMAGMVGINEISGVQHRLMLDFHVGYGFAGIAVALMGRNHPVGIILAALLFGALYQGGAELAFEMSNINRDIVVVMQGLVILFCGALEFLYKPIIAKFFKEKAA